MGLKNRERGTNNKERYSKEVRKRERDRESSLMKETIKEIGKVKSKTE